MRSWWSALRRVIGASVLACILSFVACSVGGAATPDSEGRVEATRAACHGNLRLLQAAILEHNQTHLARIDVCTGGTVQYLTEEGLLPTELQCPYDPRESGASIYLGSSLTSGGLVRCPVHGWPVPETIAEPVAAASATEDAGRASARDARIAQTLARCRGNLQLLQQAIERYNQANSRKLDDCTGTIIQQLVEEGVLLAEVHCPYDPKRSGASIYVGSGLARGGKVKCPVHGRAGDESPADATVAASDRAARIQATRAECHENLRLLAAAIQRYNADREARLDTCGGLEILMLAQEGLLEHELHCPYDPKSSGGSIYLGSGLRRGGKVKCPNHGEAD